MKPLPAQKATADKATGKAMPSLPSALTTPPESYSKANRRAATSTAQRVYPWLLATSTIIAALFCLLYITKPVIIPPPAMISSSRPTLKSSLSVVQDAAAHASLMPGGERLPGEPKSAASATKPTHSESRRALPAPPSSSAFEETNLRIQHILTAEAPGGHLDRIDLDVPVLYQSRNLRWTADEVAEARKLLVRLMDYQEQSQTLRAKGVEILDSWNRLVSDSIPASDLRADSPSLPTNQEDAADAPRPQELITTESIQIQTPGK